MRGVGKVRSKEIETFDSKSAKFLGGKSANKSNS